MHITNCPLFISLTSYYHILMIHLTTTISFILIWNIVFLSSLGSQLSQVWVLHSHRVVICVFLSSSFFPVEVYKSLLFFSCLFVFPYLGSNPHPCVHGRQVSPPHPTPPPSDIPMQPCCVLFLVTFIQSWDVACVSRHAFFFFLPVSCIPKHYVFWLCSRPYQCTFD